MIRQFIYFYMILFNGFFLPDRISHAYECDMPYECQLENIIDAVTAEEFLTIMCDVKNDGFEFKFKELNSDVICNRSDTVIFKWTQSTTGLNVLDKTFNFANAARYFAYLREFMVARFWNLNGIDVDIFGNNHFLSDNSYMKSPFFFIEIANSRLDFYHNKRKLNSCRDIIDLNLTQIRSIFQLKKTNSYWRYIRLRNLKNNRHICPLVFTNTTLEELELIDIMETFYKTNILQFANETFEKLNSQISRLKMLQVRNLNLDFNLLNPSVFEHLEMIAIESGSINSIDGTIFKTLKKLTAIEMEQSIFRKINHKQGLEWIKQINHGIYVDLTNISSLDLNKQIVLFHPPNYHIVKISKIFPDQDFCLYIDFPFNQLVIIFYQMNDYDIIDTNLSCTFFWLVQYYEYYYRLTFESGFIRRSYKKVIDFKSMSKCNFEERISLCAKSNYQVKDIWDESDFFLLNKRAETYLKASIYPISFLGIIINLIIIILILKKENMIEYKHYSYLILISLFSIMILQIYLLSWMTQCFYPYHVFCPEIRKLVAIQFFKIIFKECLVSVLRFMCSFTYIAFTLNRIGLIGNDRGMLVSLAIKKYIAVTFFISCIFSWIKAFKYQVSYFEYLDGEFPISTDKNAMNGEANSFQDFYFIFNFICDLINYFVLFMIGLELDLALVLKMRQRVFEKAVECGESDSKRSIAMLLLNILIGVFFKLPSLFIPLINVISRFYYKQPLVSKIQPVYYPLNDYKHSHPGFGEFYSMLIDTRFYYIIQDICELLFVISLPLQVFIYFNLMTKNLPQIYREITDKEK